MGADEFPPPTQTQKMKRYPLMMLAGALLAVIGHAHAQLVITEVMSNEKSGATYAADWFELTNVGSSAIDLTGYTMDDNSDSYADSVALTGVSSIAAGQSVVFIETTSNANAVSDFESSWNLSNSVVVGSYSGSGVSLGSSGDQVNIFNAAQTQIASATFGNSTAGDTFVADNTSTTSTLTTLSTVGVGGAYKTSSNEIGSPGYSPLAPVETPEPSTWAMLLVGALGLGALLRRRAVAA